MDTMDTYYCWVNEFKINGFTRWKLGNTTIKHIHTNPTGYFQGLNDIFQTIKYDHKYLVVAKIDIDNVCVDEFIPVRKAVPWLLDKCVENDQLEIIKLLDQNGGAKAIDFADAHDHFEMTKFLLSKGGDVNEAVIQATKQGHFKMVVWLLDKGADINLIVPWCTQSNNIELVKLVVRHGFGKDTILANANNPTAEISDYLMSK